MKLFFLDSKKNCFLPTLHVFQPESLEYFQMQTFLSLQKNSVGVGGMFKFAQLKYLHVAFPNDYLSLARELLALKMWKHWLCSAVGTKHFQIWLASSYKITAAIHYILL